jgi:hypothetical protein
VSQATRAPSFARRPAVLLVGLALSLGTGFVRAEADGPDYFAVRGVAEGDVLNIRAEPAPCPQGRRDPARRHLHP